MQLHRIAARVLNRPLLVLPQTAEVICSVLAERIGVEPLADLSAYEQKPKPETSRFVGETVRNEENGISYRRSGDIGIMTIEGELVNRGAWIGANSGLTSYEGIEARLRTIAKDPRVKSIVLDIESPGGEAVGAMEMAATVRKVSAEKPIHAIANGMAASAAYAIASGASRLYTTPTGLSGSIGVVLLHLDRSKELEKRGIKPTLIFAGAHKVDGHPFGPLPDSVAADLQAEVMQFYEQFVATVAAGRKNLTDKAIRATEARTFIGADAVKVGIADAVATFEDVLSEISRAAGRSTLTQGVTMSETTGAPAAAPAGITKAQLDDAVKAAADNAQKRIAAILGLDAAKNRQTLANHIAFKTAMTPDEAKAMLEASAEDKPQAQPSPLKERMENPSPGATTPAPAATDHGWGDIVAKLNAQYGFSADGKRRLAH